MRRIPLALKEPSPVPFADVSSDAADVCQLISGPEHLDRVVRGGMAKARVSLDIMTADLKAMLIPEPGPASRARKAPSVIALFEKLARQGVEVRVLHAGVPSSAALDELRKLRKRGLPPTLCLRRCPRLHTKAVVIDATRMYLGSANLTGAGLGAKGPARRNFEMGIWTGSLPMIDAVLGQFNALWEGHECENCGRRDVCPEPLEEPAV